MIEKFTVVREHLGDKPYAPGDTREAERSEVAHLIPQVLVPEGEKSAIAPKNKVATKASNKAAE